MASAIVRGLGMPIGITDGGSGRAKELADLAGGQRFDSNGQLAKWSSTTA